MTISLQDKRYMDYAIEIAKSNPDPVTNKGVGCVIVYQSMMIVGMGARHTWINFGSKVHKCVHAEQMAIMEAKTASDYVDYLPDSTVYVTMSPCTKRWHNSISYHFPSCCELLITNKVKRVVIGSLDKDFGSGGVELLNSSGIKTTVLDLNLQFLTKDAKVDDRVKHEFVEKFFK